MNVLNDMMVFNAMFPQFACTDKHSDKIGQIVEFANDEPGDGEAHKTGVFQIVGLQKNFRGELCFRVKCLTIDGERISDLTGMTMPLYRVHYLED